MDWIAPTIGAAGIIIGYLFGHFLTQRTADKEWERSKELREREWEREDARRWDRERLTAYASVSEASHDLMIAFEALIPYWARDESAPADLMRRFESQRDNVAKAHARARPLASKAVRPALAQVWFKSVEIGSSLDVRYDPSMDADKLLRKLASELGWLLGEFDGAIALELGIDH